jgi:hypothetical protein
MCMRIWVCRKSKPDGKLVLTPEELAKYDGEDGRPLYLAIRLVARRTSNAAFHRFLPLRFGGVLLVAAECLM